MIFIILFVFFCLTINKQKLEFYSLQNALVENLVENRTFGMNGTAVGAEYFTNLGTHTPQLRFIGDIFFYQGKFYPQKTYQAQYWASIIYFILFNLGLSFVKNYYLVNSILLSTSSFLLVSIGLTLTYYIAKKILHNIPKVIFITLSIGFGSLLTGCINIRNEETFGYWLLLIGFLISFIKNNDRKWLFIQLFCVWYAISALPAATLLLPMVMYRIFITLESKHIKSFIAFNLLFISLIYLNNYLIFHRITYSTYIIGIEAVPAYKRAFFAFNQINFSEKIYYYLLNPKTSIFFNYPLLAISFVGLLISKNRLIEKTIFLLNLIAFVFYICNLSDDAWVGFGSGRYALGLFPLTYIYLMDIFRTYRPWLWGLTFVSAVISIYHGLFYYFAPVRNVYNQSIEPFMHWPLQNNLLWIVATICVVSLGITILRSSIKNT